MTVNKSASLVACAVAGLLLPFATVSAAQSTTDAALTAQVYELFMSHPETRWKSIQVIAKEGVVHLIGVVHSVDERERANLRVSALPGVTGVKNDLTVGDGGH